MVNIPKKVEDNDYQDMLIEIGLKIAYYRRRKNWTQLELAEKSGLSRNTISVIEAPDMYYSMMLNTLYRLAKALDIPMRVLFDFRDERD